MFHSFALLVFTGGCASTHPRAEAPPAARGVGAATVLEGAGEADGYGFALAAGDPDGDGLAELLVGAPEADGGAAESGAVDVVGDAGVEARLGGLVTWDFYGRGVVSGGDVNADGFDDVVVGGPDADGGGSLYSVGRAWLYLGSAAGPATSAAATLSGRARADNLGHALALADLDVDGRDDLAVAAHRQDGAGTDAGRVFVHQGTSGGVSSSPSTFVSGAAANDLLGYSLAPGGDLDGDGYEELLAGAPGNDTTASGAGAVFVYGGGPTGIPSTPDRVLGGAASNDGLGLAVAGGLDVNGDGYDDLVAGSPGHDAGGSGAGAGWLYLGSAAGPSLAQGWVGEAAGDALGSAVALVPDVDGDGYAEVLLGAPGAGGGAGWAGLYLGGAGGADATATSQLEGEAAGDALGAAVVGVGDLDGDGLGEVAVGAPGSDRAGADAGAVWLLRGEGPEDADGDGVSPPEDCDDADPAVYPGAPDAWYDGVDANCDAASDYDRDGDGVDSPRGGGTDCNDGNAAIRPGAPEVVGDGVDQNCNRSDRF